MWRRPPEGFWVWERRAAGLAAGSVAVDLKCLQRGRACRAQEQPDPGGLVK